MRNFFKPVISLIKRFFKIKEEPIPITPSLLQKFVVMSIPDRHYLKSTFTGKKEEVIISLERGLFDCDLNMLLFLLENKIVNALREKVKLSARPIVSINKITELTDERLLIEITYIGEYDVNRFNRL